MFGTLLAAILSGEAAGMARRAKNAAVIYVVAVLCIAIGLGFFLAALFIWLADEFGSLWTALGFGAAFFLIAGIVLLIHAIRSKRASKIASERRRSSFATLAATAAASALPSILRGRATPLAVAVVPLVAFLAYSWLQHRGSSVDDDEE